MVIMNHSKNANSADNQQERLYWWIVGFVDGEGTFSVSINRNTTTSSGYQVFPEFVITQGEKSLNVLYKIQKYLKCGKIYVNRRHDNHNENLYRFTVRSLQDLVDIIIPFFQKYPLQTAKQLDFQLFCKVIVMMEQKEHLTNTGLIKINQIRSQMNRKPIRILNDYTPDSLIKR